MVVEPLARAGVIIGANLGTTVTAQLLAIRITDYAWAMIAAGFAAWLFLRRAVMRNVGTMLAGFGVLLIGMDQMGAATHRLRDHQPFIDQLAARATVVSPSYADMQNTVRLAAEARRQAANAIAIFAAINLAVMIRLTGRIARLTPFRAPTQECKS